MNADFNIDIVLQSCPPELLPGSHQCNARYNADTDILTVMVGMQDRWVFRRVESGESTAYLDREDTVVRVEIRQAHRAFPHGWLRQRARAGARRKSFGFP